MKAMRFAHLHCSKCRRGALDSTTHRTLAYLLHMGMHGDLSTGSLHISCSCTLLDMCCCHCFVHQLSPWQLLCRQPTQQLSSSWMLLSLLPCLPHAKKQEEQQLHGMFVCHPVSMHKTRYGLAAHCPACIASNFRQLQPMQSRTWSSC